MSLEARPLVRGEGTDRWSGEDGGDGLAVVDAICDQLARLSDLCQVILALFYLIETLCTLAR